MSPNRSGRRSSGGRGASRRSGSFTPPRRYPRMVRVNETLRQILADAIARIGDTDERLTMATVTAVDCDADFGAATVLMSSLGAEEAEALEAARIKLQAEVARQVRLKRTPLLRFAADPAVAAGARIEDILRNIERLPEAAADGDELDPGPTGEREP